MIEKAIQEEIKMNKEIKEETKEQEKLLCPKAGILVQTRRRPQTTLEPAGQNHQYTN
jgi:hypothetical protein